MHKPVLEDKLRDILKKLFKKDRKCYEICMKKIDEIIQNPEHYKPLRYDMKNIRRVHIMKSFVLLFEIRSDSVVFLDLDNHDSAYRR
ncbi:Uncharacterised protein [uncultured archaeon]|nr:Uncharacterised protein [uncultured archaeon]